MKQADLKDTLKKASKSVHAFSIVISPDNLSPTPSMSTAIKTSKNKEKDPDNPEPADEKDTQMNIPLTSCTVQV
jgi:hypothetical protein